MNMHVRLLVLLGILLPLPVQAQDNVWDYIVQQVLADRSISEKTVHLVCAETSSSARSAIVDMESIPDTEEWGWVLDRLTSTDLIGPGQTTKEFLELVLDGLTSLHREKAEVLSMRFYHDEGELYAAENAVRETLRILMTSASWNLPMQVIFINTFCINLDTSVEP